MEWKIPVPAAAPPEKPVSLSKGLGFEIVAG
jgi:hypothetical protein